MIPGLHPIKGWNPLGKPVLTRHFRPAPTRRHFGRLARTVPMPPRCDPAMFALLTTEENGILHAHLASG